VGLGLGHGPNGEMMSPRQVAGDEGAVGVENGKWQIGGGQGEGAGAHKRN